MRINWAIHSLGGTTVTPFSTEAIILISPSESGFTSPGCIQMPLWSALAHPNSRPIVPGGGGPLTTIDRAVFPFPMSKLSGWQY